MIWFRLLISYHQKRIAAIILLWGLKLNSENVIVTINAIISEINNLSYPRTIQKELVNLGRTSYSWII
jgi:hypothetical protein